MFSLRSYFKIDRFLLAGVGALVCFGLAAIYSLSLAREPETLWTLKKQLIALVLGGVCLYALLTMHYKTLRFYTFQIYLVAFLMLAGVLFLGADIRGTRGWFSFGPINFQPVEFAKLALIIILARYFSGQSREPSDWRVIFQSALIVLGLAVPTMLQPDLGSALVLFGIWFLMLVGYGIRRRVFLTLSLVILGVLTIGWFLLAPYQKERLLTFIDPARDALGQGYNVMQARIAIGSGGLFGRGLGLGSQSQLRFLPESQTDFIFSVLGEELGFVGAIFVLLLFFLCLGRLLRIILSAPDDFGAFLALGVFAVIFIQMTVNIAMNVGLLPVTGITLPFVSYGASALVIFLAEIGLALSVSRNA